MLFWCFRSLDRKEFILEGTAVGGSNYGFGATEGANPAAQTVVLLTAKTPTATMLPTVHPLMSIQPGHKDLEAHIDPAYLDYADSLYYGRYAITLPS